nr:reverse transcriptase domain-containing protein [Tanacetum cinerariifolium]
MPNNVKTYDGTRDLEDYVNIFQAATHMKRWAMTTWCHMFNSTLIGVVRVWFDELPPESLVSYKYLKAAFLAYFIQQEKYVKDPMKIHNIKQKDGETIEDFMERFKVKTERMKGAHECMRISEFMNGLNNLELTKRLNEHVSKTMKEMMINTTAFIRGEAAVSKKKGHTSWKAQAVQKANFRQKEVEIEGTLSEKERIELCSILKKNLDIFAWQPSDMKGVPGSVAEHWLNIREGYSPDCYPLSEIDWKVESLCGYPFKCFLDAYKGYHQIQVAESDEEKTTFHTGQGIGATHTPIYFIITVLQGPKLNYTPMEKQVLSPVFAAKRLCWYFQAHPITVVADQPIKQIMSRLDVILADFLIEMPDENPQAAPVAETQQEAWTLFTDGSSPSNNEAEYEALIAGLWIAAQMGVKNVHRIHQLFNKPSTTKQKQKTDALSKIESTSFTHLSKHILVEVLKDKSIKEKEMTTVVEEDGPTWMTPIVEYLKEGTLPSDRKKARKLCIKARQYELMEGILLQAVVPYAMVKMCWTAPGADAHDMIRKCNDCQIHRPITRNPQQPPTPITDPTEAVIPVEIGMPTYRTTTVDVISNDEELWLNLNLLEERRKRATICEAKAKLKMMKYYNARVRGITFRPGDFVYRNNDASHAVAGGKLGPKWERPYEVTKAPGDGAYKL